MPAMFPHDRRDNAHTRRRIANNRTDVDLVTRWKRVESGRAALYEAECVGLGMTPTSAERRAGEVTFDPQSGIATLTYTLPHSGRVIVQSWQDTSLASAKRGAIAVVEHLALDAPEVKSLDRLIMQRGHDPQHFGSLIPNNPVLEAFAPIEALSRGINELDRLLRLSPSERQATECQSAIRDALSALDKYQLSENVGHDLKKSPEWAGGRRLIALDIWKQQIAASLRADPAAEYDDLIKVSSVRCILDQNWPYK